MLTKKLFTAFLTLIFLCSACLIYGAEKKKEQIRKNKSQTKTPAAASAAKWQSDIKKALAAAKKSRKLVLLVHTAPTVNNASKLFNQHIVQNKNLAKIASRVTLVKFEYKDLKNISPAAQEAMKKYPIKIEDNNKYIMPTVYILNSDGTILEQKAGFTECDPESYLKSFKSLKEAEKLLKKSQKKSKKSNSKKNKDKKKSSKK